MLTGPLVPGGERERGMRCALELAAWELESGGVHLRGGVPGRGGRALHAVSGGHVLCERDTERVSGARGVGVGERQRDGLPVQGGVLWGGRGRVQRVSCQVVLRGGQERGELRGALGVARREQQLRGVHLRGGVVRTAGRGMHAV